MAKQKKTGIYKLTNKEDGKIYIGQAKDIEKRWITHKRTKYPEDQFTYEILMECELEQMNFWEIAWITSENACDPAVGYNKALGGTSLKVIFHTEETKAKIAAASTGKKISDEAKAKISAINTGNTYCLGYKHTDETRKNMSLSHVGRTYPKGFVRSEEQKTLLRLKNGKKCIIDGVEYASAKEAALAVGKSHSSILGYLNDITPWPNGMTGCWIKL